MFWKIVLCGTGRRNATYRSCCGLKNRTRPTRSASARLTLVTSSSSRHVGVRITATATTSSNVRHWQRPSTTIGGDVRSSSSPRSRSKHRTSTSIVANLLDSLRSSCTDRVLSPETHGHPECVIRRVRKRACLIARSVSRTPERTLWIDCAYTRPSSNYSLSQYCAVFVNRGRSYCQDVEWRIK